MRKTLLITTALMLVVILFYPTNTFSQNEQIGLGIINNKTKIFSEPKLFSKKLSMKLIGGDTVKILSESTDKFYKIEFNNKVGWIKRNKINKIDWSLNEVVEIEPNIAKQIEIKQTPKIVKQIEIIETPKKQNPKIQPQKTQTSDLIEKAKPDRKEHVEKLEQFSGNQDIEFNQTEKPSNQILSWILIIFVILLSYLLTKIFLKVRKMEKRYKPIIDIDKAVEERKKQLKNEEKSIEGLKGDYFGKKEIYDSLVEEIQLLREDLDYAAHGLYKPRFDFEISDEFKEEITRIRKKQKELVKNKEAVNVFTQWEISGNKVEGRKMTTRLTRIALRAFNGECDSIIFKVRWNNYDKMEIRINRSYDAINKMLETVNMEISREYRELKIEELYATHEYREKKYEEKEEIRRIRAEEREDKKVMMEAEKARKEAEKKQKLFEEALEKAREELGLLSEDEMEEKNKQIEELEQKLQNALEDKDRAISQAQLTKTGHVYVISNIGSFGENIYKIGLTRRLEPEMRVRELGDASVPFHFDIHAMMFSDDAPSLEHKLHEIFEEKRVNLVNRRKEFFKITLEDIEKEAKNINPEVEFYYTTESKEYKQTLGLLKTKEEQLEELLEQKSNFPDSI